MKQRLSFRDDLVKEYIKENGLTFGSFIQRLGEKFEDVNENTFGQYLSGSIKSVDIELLKAMANEIGVTLDYFCYNTDTDLIEKQMHNKLGFTAEMADNFIKNKPRRWLFNAEKRPKEINKRDYTAVLNLFLDKKIPTKIGKKSAIDVFSTNMLNLFICMVVYDKTILETFMQNYDKLSSAINVNKTQPLGNTDIDMTFDEIFNSPTIQNVYRNATHELHDSIDKLLETALKETFDSITPNKTLF